MTTHTNIPPWPDLDPRPRLEPNGATSPTLPPRALGDPRATVRIAAVIPAFNRPDDLQALLNDLASARATLSNDDRIELTVTIADNASSPPIADLVTIPDGLPTEVVRLDVNLGGSGGFNAAMQHVLCRQGLHANRSTPDFLLLVDSDARVTRDCIRILAETLCARPDLAAVGPTLRDIETGYTYEVGALVDRNTGRTITVAMHDVRPDELLECDYVAACCLLARTDAVLATGLFPDVFIYLDDIDWCIALQRSTGKAINVVPAAIAYHPWWWTTAGGTRRYYISRNALLPLARRGDGRTVRARRIFVEFKTALSLSLLGFRSMASESAMGIWDAAFGPRTGKGRSRFPKPPQLVPVASLEDTLRSFVDEFTRTHGRAPRLYVHPLFCDPWPGQEHLRAALARLDLHPESFDTWHSRSNVVTALRTLARIPLCLIGRTRADLAIVSSDWITHWLIAPRALVVFGKSYAAITINPWRTIPLTIGLLLRMLVPFIVLCVRKFPPLPLAKPWDGPAARSSTPKT